MKKILILTFPLFIITVILSLIQVVISNMLSTAGVELDQLQTELIKLNKQNIIYREEVLANTSMQNIASAAAKMGFVDTKSTVNLIDNESLTRR